ncbi:Nn.00g044680.m01.CDS01 [Neocucurbitaria sp. VM-36]
MNLQSRPTVTLAIKLILVHLPAALSYYHSPPADAVPTVNVESLFQYTTSRNHRVITQAVDFVVSMQTAPTCTRMAASHLMNECKLLEHAPDFAKSRPEAYLDNVKTEYAAKLAVCELLSAQPNNPVPPPHCEILVPSAKACGRGGSWWHTKPEAPNDKQCYPELKEYQYTQCLKSLQSTPQFWTSFSNARQNAVVMCQASRDAIERENHLDTFKNLTQVLGVVTSTMQKTTEDYESLIREQKWFSEEARDSHEQLKENIASVQEKAVATVGALDEKFHMFMDSSISQLIAALADSQSTEIMHIHQRMQDFSQDLMVESIQLSKFFTDELRLFHERSLSSLEAHHQAQVDSYSILSGHMDGVQDTVNKTNNFADISLAKADAIAQRLNTFESQTENIAEGFAFLSAVPAIVTSLVRGLVATIGILFIFSIFYKLNKGLAIYTAGACSSIFLLHACGIFNWIGDLPSQITRIHAQGPFATITNMTSTQKGAGVVLLVWLGAYPITRLNSYFGSIFSAVFNQLIGSLSLRQYSNDGGVGLLPSIEIPATTSYRNSDSSIDRSLSMTAHSAYDSSISICSKT